MSENHDCAGDAAAYVLGALDPAEAEAFRTHLAGCVVCRDELAAFHQVVDVLPTAAPQYRAPKSLKTRVMREVRAQPDQGRRRLTWASISAPLFPRIAVAAAAAVAIVAVVLATSLNGGSAPTKLFNAQVTNGGSAQVRISGGHAELIVRRFPAPPAGHIYEVWLERGSKPPSPTSTLFSVTSSGAGDIGVSGDLTGVTKLLVTPERDGGSPVPTHAPVIIARI
jgi:anti-sigma-K factor RskA